MRPVIYIDRKGKLKQLWSYPPYQLITFSVVNFPTVK